MRIPRDQLIGPRNASDSLAAFARLDGQPLLFKRLRRKALRSKRCPVSVVHSLDMLSIHSFFNYGVAFARNRTLLIRRNFSQSWLVSILP